MLTHFLQISLVSVFGPLLIALLLLLARKDAYGALILISAVALALGAVAQLGTVALGAPYPILDAATRGVAALDLARTVSGTLASYGVSAAWVLGLALAVRARHYRWLAAIVAGATLSGASAFLQSLALVLFAVQLLKGMGPQVAVAAIGYLAALVTLGYGLAARRAAPPATTAAPPDRQAAR